MLPKQYGDEGNECCDIDEEEEEKVLPEFKEGDRYELFFPVSKKVKYILVTIELFSLVILPNPYIGFAQLPLGKGLSYTCQRQILYARC